VNAHGEQKGVRATASVHRDTRNEHKRKAKRVLFGHKKFHFRFTCNDRIPAQQQLLNTQNAVPYISRFDYYAYMNKGLRFVKFFFSR
jgi:hypothetical protein